jgi:uncharacterized membrane protein YgcG
MAHVKVLLTTTPIALGLLIAPLAQAETKHSTTTKTTTSKTASSGSSSGKSGGKSGGSGNSKMPDLSGLTGLIGNLVKGGGFPR